MKKKLYDEYKLPPGFWDMEFEKFFEAIGKSIAKAEKVGKKGNTIEIHIAKRVKKHPCVGCKKEEPLCSIHPCIKVIKAFFG